MDAIQGVREKYSEPYWLYGEVYFIDEQRRSALFLKIISSDGQQA